MRNPNDSPIILALDVPSQQEALTILARIDHHITWVKIGLQLFVKYGPSLIKAIAAQGYKIFLDLKLHDIPNTVAAAIHSTQGFPIHMLSLHASGGREMLLRALEAQQTAHPHLQLLPVTVLTSSDTKTLAETGITGSPADQVVRLANLCQSIGYRGLVCSPQEALLLRQTLGQDILLVTPGIRPAATDHHDQKRTMTPAQAVQHRISFMVIGRPILQADNPQQVIATIHQEIALASPLSSP